MQLNNWDENQLAEHDKETGLRAIAIRFESEERAFFFKLVLPYKQILIKIKYKRLKIVSLLPPGCCPYIFLFTYLL